MKNALSILALMLGAQSAFAVAGAYSDAALSSTGQAMSPFDRSYEAGRAQNINQPVDYQRSKPSSLQIDLSSDQAVMSIEETETERTYRQTLEELERNRQALSAARTQTEQQLQAAKATAEQAALKRQQDLAARQAEIEEALRLNLQAQRQADQVKVEQIADIASIKAHSDQLLMLAESNAEVIESAAHKRVILERIDPTAVLNEPVSVEYEAATLVEIVEGMMPEGWRVVPDFRKHPELLTRRYQFISTDPRDLALRELTGSVRDARVRFKYFWDLKDEQGNPKPMILLSDSNEGE
ncbi:hypothetical protein I5J75_05785 [Pseudomonas aeruginosa]|nr:hypothetical protein [Pseudomonas aeruginosa]HEK3610247.1 hypothetical protein [Pseudomonas aeruginosa]